MKTKTIDKLIEMCNSGKSAAMNLCEILTVLEKEKQRKEQKKVFINGARYIKETTNNGNGTFTTRFKLKENQVTPTGRIIDAGNSTYLEMLFYKRLYEVQKEYINAIEEKLIAAK